MAHIQPPLKYDQIKDSYQQDSSWRRQIQDDRWKDKLARLLDELPEHISPHSHARIEGLVGSLLKDRS